MGGKKTCVKSREWEKERRDKLNVGFNDLSKLLPEHDPSISLSKMDILRKAAEFIRQLQDQNDEIVKSGNNDVLKNETDRLRKRVAYLVLKTKDLVNALKAAGVPIPNNNKKKGKSKETGKPVNGKDQNLVPPLTSPVVSTIPLITRGDPANEKKLITGVSSSPMNTTSTKKVKCGCDKAAKKNPLSEVNGASAVSPVIPAKGTNVTIVSCSSQTHATFLNSSVRLANVENTALTSSLGAGTLILRDGRVITVPPPTPIIPQILVKPQPAVIVMQRATPVAIKREKFPLIFPKRRDITQTTYMNKTPIPAIKTFRLESIKRSAKTSKAKNKKDSKQESVNNVPPPKLSDGKGDQSGVTSRVTSLEGSSTVDLSSIIQPSAAIQRKRKGEPVNRRAKVLKSSSVSVSNGESAGNLQENKETNCANSSVDVSTVVEPINTGQSPGISRGDKSEITSDSIPGPITAVETASNETDKHESPYRDVPPEDCQKEPPSTSIQIGGITEPIQKTLSTLDSIDVDQTDAENISTVTCNIPKELPPSTGISPENCPLFSLPLSSKIVDQENTESSAAVETIQNDTECPESQINPGICLPEGSQDVSKPLDNQVARISNQLFSKGDINDDPDTSRTKVDNDLKQPEPEGEPSIELQSKDVEVSNELPVEESPKQGVPSEPEKLTSIPDTSSFQKDSPEKVVTPEKPLLHAVECCESINSQYDINISESVNPDQMFSFDDSVHGQLDSFTAEPIKTQRDCNTSNTSNVSEILGNPSLENGKKDNVSGPSKMPKDITNDINACTDTSPAKIITSQDSASFKSNISVEEQLAATPNSNKHVASDADKHLMPCSDDNHLHSSSTSIIPGMSSEKFTISMSTLQSQAKLSLMDAAPPTTFTSGSQMYPIAMTEQTRTESFFNYDNPIATLPSADPFFPNFLGKTADVVSTSSTTTPTTCFSCTNFTTQVQAPPVRSVARQLFPADPLCSISNSYNMLNNRQSELETNLPHLSAANTQMFQFSSYSSASSYRDPVFFANDFVSTPSKTGPNLGSLENFSQNDKGGSMLHPTSNYPDLLHSSGNLNNFPNLSCNFSVAPSTSCIATDYIPVTSTQKPSHKQCIVGEPLSGSMVSQAKPNSKPCSSEGNFSMNMITSSSASKSEIKSHIQCPSLDSTGYQKTVNCEPSQNLNFNYLHPLSHSQSSQVNQEIGYNLYTRDTAPLPRNIQNHNFRSTGHVAAINSAISSEKNYQKPFNHGLNSINSSVTKDFNVGETSLENRRDSGERFSIQSNIFHDSCNQYPDHSSKNQHGNTNTGTSMSNFQGGGSSQLSSNNQGVQTQQSYVGSSNAQHGSKMSKNATLNASGNQSYSGPSQSSNRQNHAMQPDKYSRVVSMKQDLPRSIAGPHYSMKLGGGNRVSDGADCTGLRHHSQESYQIVPSLAQSSQQVQTSNSSQNLAVFSSSNVFPHPNLSTHNRSYQGPIFSSYSSGSISNNAQTIYTNPTTAVPSNHAYLQGTNTSSAAHRGPNILSPNTLPKATSLHNSQLPVPGNHPPSSTGQMFSTIETLAHHNHDVIGNNNKNHVNSGTNPAQHPSQLTSTNPPNGNFPGTNPPQSIIMSTNRKSAQNDGMPSFSMSSLSGYSQNAPLANVQNQHAIAKRLHSSGHNYNNLQTSIQNGSVNKSSSQYTPAPTNILSTTKQCDYPLASILTGLNDPILSGGSIGNGGNSTHLNKNTTMPGVADKSTGCREKAVDKQYSTNTEGNSFKTTDNSCSTDYLRSKENERNSFIPIMEDVRLNSEFSNDLFSSLQVPTGGAHSDSISPTAAFLLAFPLVSTSKNTENPHEQDPAENNTSTPTTILQIGNIEPPNSELFHPLEFGKDIETSDYLGQVQDKCKRKESSSQEKHKKQVMSNAYPQTYNNYPGMSGDFSVTHYEQPWSENHNKSKPLVERKKSEKPPKQFNNSNTYEFCKQDKKKKNKISVNWMAAPDAADSFQKEVETSSFPAANLPFPMDIDGLPDLCTTKKSNSGIYSWSPNKSLLPLDNGLLIPSTLPTLVGDLALGTTTPSDPFSKRCDNKKSLEKQLEKTPNSQKSQNNFLSVSQLVDPKSKKHKIPDTKCKKQEKKKTASFSKRKDSSEPCMYPDNLLPPLGWDKYRYKNNYSAEALIGSQDMNDSLNFPYQQNANYFMGPDFNQEHHPQSQQYQNSLSFSQNQFSTFVAEEYQSDNFSLNQPQASSSKRVSGVEKRDVRFLSGANSNPPQYHHSNNMQPPHTYPVRPLPPSSAASSQPSNFPSNTTTSVTNFNLSTIFPEINERTGSQSQPNTAPQQQQNQQQHQQQNNIQQHSHNSVNSFSNNTNNSYRPHNV